MGFSLELDGMGKALFGQTFRYPPIRSQATIDSLENRQSGHSLKNLRLQVEMIFLLDTDKKNASVLHALSNKFFEDNLSRLCSTEAAGGEQNYCSIRCWSRMRLSTYLITKALEGQCLFQ